MLKILTHHIKPRKTRSRPPADWDGYYREDSGFLSALLRPSSITPETALSLAPVYACVQLLSRSAAVLPLPVYRREGENRVKATDHPLTRLLKLSPNRWQTHFEFIESIMIAVLLRGNFYAQILRNKFGVTELIPIHPDRVTVEQIANGELIYKVRTSNGAVRVFFQREILHIKGLSTDGINGISPIEAARRTLALSVEIEEHSEKFFKNRGFPGVVLKHPGKMSEQAYKNLKDSFTKQFSNDNAFGTAIVEEGLDISQIAVSAQDAQLIDQKRMGIEDIARIFGVPPHKIGDLSRATFSNIEHQGIDFVVYSLMPWLKKIEEAMILKLIPPAEQDFIFIEFSVDGLLRGDLQSRYEAYNVGRNAGFLSVNDIRRKENLDPLPNGEGDVYLIPANMTNAKLEGLSTQEPAKPKKATDIKRTAIKRSLVDILSRIIRRELKSSQKVRSAEDFEVSHGAFIVEALQDHIRTAIEIIGERSSEGLEISPLLMNFNKRYFNEDRSAIEAADRLATFLIGLIEEF